MRIGIHLRHLDQHGGGVLVYTEGLLRELFRAGAEHEFVLFYRDASMLGRYADDGHVREVAIPARSLLTWDQIAAPRAARREAVDLVFNPKYSIPLMTPVPGVFVCHGLDWYAEPQWSRFTDRLSHRHLVPRYARKARRIIAVSEFTKESLERYLAVDPSKIDTVRLGVDDEFRRPVSEARLAGTRERYDLPERYFLYSGQIYPPKNFGRLVQAFAAIAAKTELDLVVAGKHASLCEDEIASIDRLGLSARVHQLGWVPREALPALYKMATALVMPSLYEACPSPPLEAMACGCPVVAADRTGLAEIVEDAARLVDPEDVSSIAQGMMDIVEDEQLRETLIARGLCVQAGFTWQRCAEQTVASLERALADGG